MVTLLCDLCDGGCDRHNKDFYTASKAAELRGVSEVTIQNWCKSGQRSSYRVGVAYRIPKEAVDAQRRVASAPLKRRRYLRPTPFGTGWGEFVPEMDD